MDSGEAITGILVLSLVAVAVTVLPVMLAARALDAGRSGFGAALVAVVLQAVLGQVIRGVDLGRPLELALAILAGSVLFSVVLDTSVLRGFLINILAAAIALGSIFLLIAGFGAFGIYR